MHPGQSDSPILTINQASVDKLWDEVKSEDFDITYELFRANIVFRGDTPFEEDKIRDFSIKSDTSQVKGWFL